MEEKDKLPDEPKMTPELFDTIQSQNVGEGTLKRVEETETEEPDTVIDALPKEDIEFEEEYSDEIIKDIMKNPSKYKMTSPKHGEMNLKDAMDRGYNPETDEFDRDMGPSKEELMEGLSDTDKESINNITDPRNAKFPRKEAEAMGFDDEEMIDQGPMSAEALPEMPSEEGEAMPEGAGLEALLGGMM